MRMWFYVLFKLNLKLCRESWYTTKIISGKPLTYDILYKKEKERGKKTHLLRALLSLSLEIDEDDIWFSK